MSDPLPIAGGDAEAAARPQPDGYAEEWAWLRAQPAEERIARQDAALRFRVAGLTLAVSAAWVKAVAEQRAVCAVPHRRNTAFLGLVAHEGEILPCCSLARMLGLAEAVPEPEARMLIVEERPGERWAFPVGAALGMVRGRLEEASDIEELSADWSGQILRERNDRITAVLQANTLFARLARAVG